MAWQGNTCQSSLYPEPCQPTIGGVFFMSFKCHSPECNAQVAEQYKYCLACQNRYYGGRSQKLNNIRIKLLEMSKKNTSPAPSESSTPDYFSLPLDQLKTLEKTASEWLIINKTSPYFPSAKQRYTQIVKVLNIRTPI